MGIKSKIGEIERALEKSNNGGLIEFAVIHTTLGDWREREAAAVRNHLERYGNLNRLRIIRTLVPPVAPRPSDEALALVHGSGNSAQ